MSVNLDFTIEKLWGKKEFIPTNSQTKAILHVNGPLFITAGPGSGKTKVLLWRTVNLIVFHDIKPSEIVLCTFTEKAALQLKEGLLSLLGLATEFTGKSYDISEMAIGTIHSICQKLITNRHLPTSAKPKGLQVMDAFDQYRFLNRSSYQKQMFEFAGFSTPEEAMKEIITVISGQKVNYVSRFKTTDNLIKFFNRLSEENYEDNSIQENSIIQKIISMYQFYRNSLTQSEKGLKLDLSLLQQCAYTTVRDNEKFFKDQFKHIIIDEYQDTNPIQEKLLFQLAKHSQNICVVGDDDQSLYRFRGATVENFVEFSDRCLLFLKHEPVKISLDTNFRSREEIVHFYKHFINHESIEWKKKNGQGYYRVTNKEITANRLDNDVALVKTKPGTREECANQIANLIKDLKESNIISDYNQVACLFPSLGSKPVIALKDSLSNLGIPVFAPRAGKFINVEEATQIFGLILGLFDAFNYNASEEDNSENFSEDSERQIDFSSWLREAKKTSTELLDSKPKLSDFLEMKNQEIEKIKNDFRKFSQFIEKNGWTLDDICTPQILLQIQKTPGVSESAMRHISNRYFVENHINRFKSGNPAKIKYVINRATSLDWSLLDLFYQICSFSPFREDFDLAQSGEDEAPIFNLSQISVYLSKFSDTTGTIISASRLENRSFSKSLNYFLNTLHHINETEFEDKENPFPKGRVPFLTTHQSKGLEFPVVVLGTLLKKVNKVDYFETLIRGISNRVGEPLDKIGQFDLMRLFYVALSRPQNLLILPDIVTEKGKRQYVSEPFKTILAEKPITEIQKLNLDRVPKSKDTQERNEKIYSFTSDYTSYENCPRQYMVFRKYGFVPSRSQTHFFGQLVHRTIEDLHRYLINSKKL